ncbi:TMEM1 family protein-like protein [Westerdykella ornata]|uniref:TMEM1 family protein-like protein n=1 Tax=Westerdykella ornata TaxID=318751 RepID=A0A6A6JCX7_WESOR|nr:TMEM1 family protein-like protein [Westerdykella ornata]KAF2274282.1 TMEM1 family protein-like protein [Westerdykella ornata]
MSGAGNGAAGSEATENASRPKTSEPPVMDGSSSSKVTVEYHDPSGLFPLVQEQLASRFPLRNLHWKSPTRPLRSIDSLHVDLVPSQDSVHIAGVTSGLTAQDGSQTAPANRSASSGEILRPPSKERRHQIPGLRQTPYLKVYLLRCDDSDTYKATARKQLREWVKAHTPPSQSSSSSSTQENHDAFEWMILHVVVPDTPAASQPRGSASSTTSTGEKEKSSATSRWTRGTTTILEKIRADFNISSKSAPDRVAQVRLRKDAVPPHMLPTTTATATPPITESPQEEQRAWADVIAKFKSLILLSFDLRVRQYEEDIREKEAQRVLPGWNFCTFFMLKEGLARGFESAGLVEDALLGYDELSVGLDSVIRDQANDGSGGPGGEILAYTEELFEKAQEIYKRSQKDDGGRKEPMGHIHDARPIDSRKKNYRDLILSNKISIFDFRCYIFARQMSLLLRLGNAHSARSDLAAKLHPRPTSIHRSISENDVPQGSKIANSKEDSEDLLALAELCSRALNFITFAGRLLREDLINGAKAHDTEFPQHLIDNLVHSWTYAALQQLIEETATSSLPISRFSQDISTSSSGKMQPFGDHSREQKLSFAEPKTMIHPTRSSSLHFGRSSSADPPYAQTPPSAHVIYENGQHRDRPVPPVHEVPAGGIRTGSQELAATRAQLYIVQRRILENIGKSLGWMVGWAAILPPENEKEELSDVDLSEAGDPQEVDGARVKPSGVAFTSVGLSAAALVDAISSEEHFRQCYETLSDTIVKHYMAAGQVKAAESVLGDLAALRYDVGDYAAAAMYFGRMASSFAESRWNLVEATMLRLYAQCLKKLNRKDEYVRTLLDLLTKSAAHKRRVKSGKDHEAGLPNNWLDDDKLETAGVLAELIEYSEQLPYDKTVAMNYYFEDISVEPFVRHYEDKDGFQLRLTFRHVLEDGIVIDRAKVHLVGTTPAQTKDIWLDSTGSIEVKRGICRVWLNSNVNTTGPYVVDKILLSAKRILFSHEPFSKAEATTPLGIITSVSATSLKVARKNRILCYPRPESLGAKVGSSNFIHMDQPRSIEIQCSSGWNAIQKAEIRLKSASAGLRLRTANTTVTEGDIEIMEKGQKPGVFTIASMSSDTTARYSIPYELETMLPELSIKLEIDYTTDRGQFQYHSSFTIPIELPLDVNVHDHFKNEALFSKFNIKTANQTPLEILKVGLEGSEEYDVIAPKMNTVDGAGAMVFPKQPLAVTYRIVKKPQDKSAKSKAGVKASASNTGSLALSVTYRCLDEDVLDRLCALFTSAMKDSPVANVSRLLAVTFAQRVKQRVLPHQMERIALLEKVNLGSFEDMNWGDCLDGLPPTVRKEVSNWLKDWCQKHRTILLPSSNASPCDPGSQNLPSAPPSPNPPRHIIITVSIPHPDILFTASLSLSLPTSSSPPTSQMHMPIAISGKPLHTTLRIKHTRLWARAPTHPAKKRAGQKQHVLEGEDKKEKKAEFVYTMLADPETWLVAGQRRGHFSLPLRTAVDDEQQEGGAEEKEKEGSQLSIPLILIPLVHAGVALLPTIDIRPVVPERRGDGETAVAAGTTGAAGQGYEEERMHVETDWLSAGESVVVVPDVRSATVGVAIGENVGAGEKGGMGGGVRSVWVDGVGL